MNLPEPSLRPSSSPTPRRPFTCAHGPLRKHHQLPPRPKPPPESEIDEKFLKGSGPGGQKIVRFLSLNPYFYSSPLLSPYD